MRSTLSVILAISSVIPAKTGIQIFDFGGFVKKDVDAGLHRHDGTVGLDYLRMPSFAKC